ncbi:hypothetical protein MBLNU230_g0889t1 [Neophaeotheca triangularis]
MRVQTATLHLLSTLSVPALSLGPEWQQTQDYAHSKECRCFPGDQCWPDEDQWGSLNETVQGRLVATVPLASPCYYGAYDPYSNSTCAALQNAWIDSEIHFEDSASVMAPYFANRSCDPFLGPSGQCVIGTYVQYSIDVSCAEDVSAGIKFANEHNIRLVIRNTGHDYNGKSTGAGALGLWMHHLKDISFTDRCDEHYTGKAIKMGAGVQGIEAYRAADAEGLQVVGGECPTVGLAGGYTQGGGHSSLASKHGLAADQALEWEVVTGTGDHMIATPSQNQDLYWALSGGGGGTYGVVLSLTAKAHPDCMISGFNMTFTSSNISQDAYYEAIGTFHASLEPMVDAGITSVWFFTNETFTISPLTAPEISVEQLKRYLAPLENKLTELAIPHTSHYETFPGFLQFYDAMQGPIDVGIAQYGGRLVPRSVVQKNNTELTETYRSINKLGAQFIGVALDVSKAVAGGVDNAVNPGWRDCLIDTVITTPWNFTAPWEEMLAQQDLMTDVLIPKLAAFTPNGSCYLSEGDFRQPDWQSVFYGRNYERLLSVKRKYDPFDVFYATTAVGSEYWEVAEDNRLCRAGR